MPTYFFDTSALVKRHFAEPGHVWVRALYDHTTGNSIVVCEVALVEVTATFARMARETPRRIGPVRRDRLIADFEAVFLRQYIVVQMNHTLLARAAALCHMHPLRTYDAVQLAAALIRCDDDLAAGNPAPIFVCSDRNLLAVAPANGFTVEDPNS